MFGMFIAWMLWIAVYLLVRQVQQRGYRQRRQKQAQAYLLPAEGVPARQILPGWKAPGFAWLEWLGGLQDPRVPKSYAENIEKKLLILPAWKDRRASHWLAWKESTGAMAAVLGMGMSLPVWVSILLGAAAFYLPDLWLQEKALARRRAILRELPALLELLACCLDAGLGFEPAVGIIVEKSRPGHLRQEFGEIQRRLRMGESRREAWEHMSRRLDDPEIKSLTGVLAQAERLGTGLSETLRNQAARLRSRHAQQVEKTAQEASIKLLFPLILCIFPVVFIILFGPMLLRLWQAF